MSGRFLEGGKGNPLQHSCLENHIDRVAWQATVPRVARTGTTEATLHTAHSTQHSLDENLESWLIVHQGLEDRSKIPLILIEKCVSQGGKNCKTRYKV